MLVDTFLLFVYMAGFAILLGMSAVIVEIWERFL